MNRRELVSEIAKDLASFKRVLMASRVKTLNQNLPTPAQIGILVLLAQEGPQNLKDVANQLCMSSSAATQLVDGLVADRLLTRREDAVDRRRIQLALTAAGKRTMTQAKKAHLATLTKMVTPLSDQELKEWQRLQRKIIEHASYE